MEYVSNAFKDTRTSAITLGVGTVVLTHVVMLVVPSSGPPDPSARTNHALINLAGAGAIIWGSRLLG